jgi:hypothetical protein
MVARAKDQFSSICSLGQQVPSLKTLKVFALKVKKAGAKDEVLRRSNVQRRRGRGQSGQRAWSASGWA